MSAVLLRFLLYGLILGAIYFGLRRILRDWKSRFSEIDQKTRERDQRERQRPDVIDLKRGKDGVFRPGGRKDGRGPGA